MNEFIGLLQTFKDNNTEFVAALNCRETTVKVKGINGDLVTLIESGGAKRRYDLHYTQIIICSIPE